MKKSKQVTASVLIFGEVSHCTPHPEDIFVANFFKILL
jgi:hypothetical protein